MALLKNPPLEGVLSAKEFGRLGAFLLGSAGSLGAASLLILAITSPSDAPSYGFHPLMVAVLSGAVLVAAILSTRWSERLYPRWAGVVMAATTVLVTIVAFSAGARQAPFVTIFYVWVGTSFVILPNRVAVLEVVFVGVVHAVLLAVQPGHPAAVAEWIFTFGVTAITAWVVKHVVETLVDLARGERAARAEAERGNDALEELSRRETAFLTRMSHEVRNPLNSIIGFADMLGDGMVGALNDQQADYVGEVRNSGRHLLDLIGDVLDVARVAEGREDLVLRDISVGSVLGRAVNLFRNEADRRGIDLEVVDAEVSVGLRGDERKVRQVLLNLLSNAVKFTPPGGRVVVSAAVADDAAVVTVADTGPGIGPEDVERIFEEYRQAPPGAALGAGTGLGLPLARHLAELHGGSLAVESVPGRGSTFRLSLPLGGPSGVSASGGRPASRVVDAGRSSRWRSPLENPDLRAKLAPVAPLLGMGAILLGGVTLLVHALHPVAGYHPIPLLVIATVATCVAIPLYAWARGLPPAAMAIMLPAATVMFTLSSYYVGAFEQPYGAMLFVWVAVVAVSLVSRRQVVAQVAFVGVAYAFLLAVQSGNNAPVVRWLIVLGVVIVSAVGIDTLLSRLGALADAERDARVRLESVRADLEAASRHKTRFLATMSHELRTPLNAIIGFSDVLADELFGPLSDKQGEYVRDLTEAGRELLALVNDILDLAKVDAGRMELEISGGVDVFEALRTTAAGARPVPVHLEVDDEIGPVDVDVRKFCRIVGNLIDEEAVADGSRRVTVTAEANDGRLVVDVVHEGPQRARTSPRLPAGGGAPLRVGVAAALAELHGGAVEPIVSGWRLLLPTRLDLDGTGTQDRERV